MLIVRATPELLTLLRERRVFHFPGRGDRWKDKTRLGLLPGCQLEPYSSIMEGFYIPAAIGAFAYSHSALSPALHIGRYASIGVDVRFMGDRHPIEWVSGSPFFGELGALPGPRAYFEDHDPAAMAGRRHYEQPDATIRIGADVWVGDEAMIARGVTIGDGAVVAARSLVLKDVAPYAVVAGSPAQVIRLRFPEAIVERLLASQWWRYDPAVLDRLPVEEPQRFLDDLDGLMAGGAPPEVYAPAPLTYDEIVAAGEMLGEWY